MDSVGFMFAAPGKTTQMLIGALLRVPAQAIQRRIIRELNAAGFDGLTMAHMPLLHYPGPNGVRPSTLAERAGMSKQALNRLLGTLEDLGYVARSDSPEEGVVHELCALPSAACCLCKDPRYSL